LFMLSNDIAALWSMVPKMNAKLVISDTYMPINAKIREAEF